MPAIKSTSLTERIGLVGLGLMGTAFAERLLRGRFAVLGWDISATQRTALRRLGGQTAKRAAEVAASCRRLILSLPQLDEVNDWLREGGSSLRRGQILIDTTTGAPDQTVKLARALAKRGVIYLDATISGNSDEVRAGNVTVLVGGPKEAVEQGQDLFRLFAKQVIHTGPSGSGTKMKLVTNLVLGLNRAALAEGLVFARALGLDATQALHVLSKTTAYSRIMDTKGAKMVRGDFKAQARLSQHLKDVQLMLAAARKAAVQLPLSRTHRQLLERAQTAGYGQLDNAAIIRVIGAKPASALRNR